MRLSEKWDFYAPSPDPDIKGTIMVFIQIGISFPKNGDIT